MELQSKKSSFKINSLLFWASDGSSAKQCSVGIKGCSLGKIKPVVYCTHIQLSELVVDEGPVINVMCIELSLHNHLYKSFLVSEFLKTGSTPWKLCSIAEDNIGICNNKGIGGNHLFCCCPGRGTWSKNLDTCSVLKGRISFVCTRLFLTLTHYCCGQQVTCRNSLNNIFNVFRNLWKQNCWT